MSSWVCQCKFHGGPLHDVGEHVTMKISLRRSAARGLDELFCRGMQTLARRQQRRFPPPQNTAYAIPEGSLFCPPSACDTKEVYGTPWQRRGQIWRRDFSFPSALASAWPENNTVFVRIFAPDHRPQRPAVLVLHGLMSISTLAYRPFLHAIVAAGATAYFIELPFHHRRTPLGSFSGDLFYTANFELTWQAARQAIADVRRLTLHLRANAAPLIGILGFSLGAWLAALAICGEPELDFALLAMPPASFNDLIWHSPLGRRLRKQLEQAHWTPQDTASLTVRLDPLSYQPLLPRERIEIFAGTYDVLVPFVHVQALQQAWLMPSLHHYAAGHLTIMLSRQFKHDAGHALRRQMQRGRLASSRGAENPSTATIQVSAVEVNR